MNQTSASGDLARFDVRDIPCRIKHGQILQRWAELTVHGHFILINDHDPIPLYYQFTAHFPGAFDWEYLVRGPDEFQVKITRLAVSAAPALVPAQTVDASAPKNVLDVRSIPPQVKHARIFECWNELRPGEYLELINDHDPVPLRYQFEAQFPGAFFWEHLATGPEMFRVKVTKIAADLLEIDARGLEPPEPLVRILNALETLPRGFTLRGITDREPCHLFGEAKQRGFQTDCKSQPDGSWHTYLTRA